MSLRLSIKRELKEKKAAAEMNFEEKLIIAIQKHACLYDKQAISYRKRIVKQKAWSRVSAEVGTDVKECQHRWRSLRDRYVREIRAKPDCKWRYMSKLKFLNPYLDSRTHLKQDSVTDEESCNYSEAYSSFEYEKTKPFVAQQEVQTLLPMPTPISILRVKTEKNSDNEEIEVSDHLPLVSIPSVSELSLTSIENEVKRRRLNSDESMERLGRMSETNNVETSGTGNTSIIRSRNEDYYKTLDSYMLQLPLNVQDDLKIEILNRVYMETKKQ